MEIFKTPIGTLGAELTGYLQSKTPAISASDRRPAVLIFPGGGYEFVSDSENEPVALAYSAQGFQAFVLRYSVGKLGQFPTPQREAFLAIAYLRSHAAELMLDPGKIAVVGFSAGGHLAASVCVHWNNPAVNPDAEPKFARPDAAALVYPCITTGEFAYPGIRSVHAPDPRESELASLERFVAADTPPAYLCHTAEDTAVHVMNSLLYAEGLARCGVNFSLRVFSKGPHGMGLATKAVSSPFVRELDFETRTRLRDTCRTFSEWFGESAAFLRDVFGL